MDEIKFPLYQENGKKDLSRFNWLFGIIMSGLIILWVNQKYVQIDLIEKLILPVVFCFIMVYIFFIIYSINEKEKLNGSFIGYLIFSKQKISAANEEFELSQIKKLVLNFYDYDGKKWVNPRSPEPKVSNGVNNFLTIELKDGVTLKFFFQQAYENEFEMKMKDLLIHYHLQDKISFLALIQYIGISNDYERIQVFKKELYSENQ